MCTGVRGQGTGDGGKAQRTEGKVRYRLGGRASLRVVVGCGLLAALSPPAAQARPRLEGHPKPPSQAQINAAENQVRQYQAALGAAQGKLSAASAELSRLQTQAEVLIERYDQAQVNEQHAASAYKVTEARLRQAEQQQAASPAGLSVPSARRADRGVGTRRLELVEHLTVGERDELGHVAVRAERCAALGAD